MNVRQLLHRIEALIEHRWGIADQLTATDRAVVEHQVNGHEERLNALRAELRVIRHEVEQSEEP